MALIHCDFTSEVLDLNTSMCVILPEPPRSEGGFRGRGVSTGTRLCICSMACRMTTPPG
jgi:hypothetical protein